ncbi:MAG: hypothetical protein VYB15_12330, partial [Planctomycetota bacterium]|nr:hypothetical protein [Planctomycetota bacterium]
AAQGLLVFVTLGLGLGIGSKISGWIVDYYKDPATGNHDWQAIWMWPAGMAAVVLVLFGLLFRDPPVEDGAESTEAAPLEEDATAANTGEEEANDDEDGPVMPIAGE